MDLPSKESINSQKKRKNLIKDAILVVSIIIAVIIGIILGLGLRTPWTANDKRKIFYLRFPGQLLLNMLQCLIFPLIVSSLITATALLDQKASRRLGLGAIIYCMTTTLTSVVLGIILVLAIHPGNPSRLSVIRRSGSAEDAKPIDAIMDLIRYSPIGIIFLIASKFVETDDIGDIAARLGMYMVTVLAGLAIHAIIILPLIYFLATRKNPAIFALNMSKAILTAWGTASSSATLPVTMECLTMKNKVNERVVRFVAPIGATINMDGTALYEAVASIFIAQVNGISLGVADVIIVSLTSTAAAIGAAGVPQAGLVTMVIVLTAVNLPTEDVTLILAIDWFLDRFRTAVNVWGDSVGAGILNHFFRNLFRRDDEDPLTPDSDSNNSRSSIKKEPLDDRETMGNEQINQAYEDATNAMTTRM